jgi:hypothetical protein
MKITLTWKKRQDSSTWRLRYSTSKTKIKLTRIARTTGTRAAATFMIRVRVEGSLRPQFLGLMTAIRGMMPL